jgi:Flp pilus assembly protein TadB
MPKVQMQDNVNDYLKRKEEGNRSSLLGLLFIAIGITLAIIPGLLIFGIGFVIFGIIVFILIQNSSKNREKQFDYE